LAVLAFLAGGESLAQTPLTQITTQSQEQLESGVLKQEVLFPGWDEYEPVTSWVYLKPGAKGLPVVIFIHGMGANRNYLSDWHADLATRGFAVISIDAFLSGDRKIKTSIGGIKAEQDNVWAHQTAVNHTAHDVQRILDLLHTRPEFDPTRVAVTGFSMGGSTAMTLAWREPRISAIMPLCGAVDFWWDMAKVEPGPAQVAKIAEFTPRLKQLIGGIDPNVPQRMDAILPKALFLQNGAKDGGIDIRSVRKFADQMRSRYEKEKMSDRFDFFEDEEVDHSFSAAMREKGTAFLVRHLIEKPIRQEAMATHDIPAADAKTLVTTIHTTSEEKLASGVLKEQVLFPGWDPYEPVTSWVYRKPDAKNLPVVIFIHGMGANRNYLADWHAELAEKGFAVISIDAHLSGDRKIKTPVGGAFKAEQGWVWPHQTVVNHTTHDVQRMLDLLHTRPEFDPSRVAVTGFSMGGATTMVLAWREPRISAVMPLCGCVDFWWDVTKIDPGAEQEAKIAEFTPRLKQLTGSLDSNVPERMDAILPKALCLLNGTKDGGIDIRSIRKFADDMRPRYKAKDLADRLEFFEDPEAGHDFSPPIKERATAFLVRHLIEKPIHTKGK
jgi:dienelactone hydrolase